MGNELPLQVYEKPWAAEGFTSYRYKGHLLGYVMLGATDHMDALQKASDALPSRTVITQDKLDIYIGGVYVPATEENNPKGR